MSLITITVLGRTQNVEVAVRNLRSILEVLDERTEAGDNDFIRKELTINSRSGQVNRIEIDVSRMPAAA